MEHEENVLNMPTLHIETLNTSALVMYKILRNRQIKNNKFFLLLYDKDLMRVDPFSSNLSVEEKVKITNECIVNPFYYYREIYRIPEVGGYSKFKFDIGNLAQLFLMHQNINILAERSRQTGKTWAALAAYDWIYHFGVTSADIIFGNKNYADAELNIRRFADSVLLRPNFMKESFMVNKKNDINNIKTRYLASRKNTIKEMSSPTSEEQADKLGRGLTSPCLWLDEFAFLKFNGVVYGSASPALSKAMEVAKEKGLPHGKLITTTPNFRDCEEGAYCYNMMENAAIWHDELFDLTTEELQTYIKENSTNDFIRLRHTWKDLGKSEEWYIHQCRQVNNESLKIKREINIEWTFASDNSIFDEEVLENAKKFVVPPLKTELIDKVHPLILYEELKPSDFYVLSVDVAGGLTRDNTVITIIKYSTNKLVALFKSNKISIPTLEHLIANIVRTTIPNSIVVIERNNNGLAVLQHLLQDSVYSDLRSKIFYYYKADSNKVKTGVKNISDMSIVKRAEDKRIYGVNTTGMSREEMLQILNNLVTLTPELIVSEEIFNEILTLEIKSNQKIEHRSNAHDDCIFAMVIGHYAMKQSSFSAFVRKIVGLEPESINAVQAYSKFLNASKTDPYSDFTRKYIDSISTTKKIKTDPSTVEESMIDFISTLNKK
jgi:hypothetical protein